MSPENERFPSACGFQVRFSKNAFTTAGVAHKMPGSPKQNVLQQARSLFFVGIDLCGGASELESRTCKSKGSGWYKTAPARFRPPLVSRGCKGNRNGSYKRTMLCSHMIFRGSAFSSRLQVKGQASILPKLSATGGLYTSCYLSHIKSKSQAALCSDSWPSPHLGGQSVPWQTVTTFGSQSHSKTAASAKRKLTARRIHMDPSSCCTCHRKDFPLGTTAPPASTSFESLILNDSCS